MPLLTGILSRGCRKGSQLFKARRLFALEVGDEQSQEVCTMISLTGEFCRPETLKDLSNIARVVKSFKA